MEQIGTTESANTKTDESARLVASKGERGKKSKGGQPQGLRKQQGVMRQANESGSILNVESGGERW